MVSLPPQMVAMPLSSFLFMVEDHEGQGSAPAFGGRVGGVQGPRPREGAEDAVAVDFREKHAAHVEQLMHFGGIGHGVVGLVGLLGGGAEDGGWSRAARRCRRRTPCAAG